MTFYLKLSSLILIAFVLMFITVTTSKSIGETEKVMYPSEFDLVEDDGTPDTALLNYLYARQLVNRLRRNLDISDLQRKRSYWKQCAFNAVSCFGR